MATNSSVDCPTLGSFKNFVDYINNLRLQTGFENELLEHCQQQICHSLWGESNPDISGIGVFIGYVMEVTFGYLVAVLYLVVADRQGLKWKFWQRVVRAGFEAFFDFAIYFAISISIAVVIMLLKNDYGISTDGFGANEAHMGLALSVISILPLLYPVGLLSCHSSRQSSKTPTGCGEDPDEQNAKEGLRLLMFCLLSVLAFYPFVSKCIHNWKPSQVGESKGPGGQTIILQEEWNRIESLCFGSIDLLSETEQRILAFFELMASVSIFLFAIWHSLSAVMRKMKADDLTMGDQRRATAVLEQAHDFTRRAWRENAAVRRSMLFMPVILAGPLLWNVRRLRSIQSAVAERLRSTYAGDDWGFGQIVAIVIFVPMVTEMAFAAWSSRFMWTQRGNPESLATSD